MASASKYNVFLPTDDKIAVIYNLSTMLAAGIPIVEVMSSLLEDAKGPSKKLLQTLRDDLNQGSQLWSAMAKYPYIFDKVTVSIVQASEQAGTLDVTLKDIRLQMQKDKEFSDKVRGAFIYPAIIGGVFGIVMVVILFFVLPKLAAVFKTSKVNLPATTQFLFNLSEFLNKNWLPVTIVFGILMFIASIFFKYNRNAVMSVVTGLPGIVKLMRQIDMTRFTRSLYLLLSSGITITQALELTEQVVGRPEIRKVIHKCREMVTSGKYLSEGFRNAKAILPSIVVKITEAGEKSGNLEKSMQDVSEFLDYQTSNTLRVLTAAIEPIMLVTVGILIGGMMLSIISPMYQIIGSVGNK
jgi:type IV pilus assembly protein PilC